jgi:serine/threonine-protein kinase
VDRATFLDNLRESRLLTEEQFAAFLAEFPAEAPARELGRALLERGQLTPFQANQIWEGHGASLLLGQYRILDELGKGGFGLVFKAVHTMMDRVVALKVINPELVQDEQARQWFRREVLASTKLHHPNIVMAFDANEVDGNLFLVMEYVDGPNLDALVKAQGPLPVPLACEVIRQAALALQHAHEKGMVHRDIKPANLLIAHQDDPAGPANLLVKVTDFGLARLHRTATAGTLMPRNEKSFIGTPDYVSPEQARDLHAVDIRSDLYSLGCTLYFTFTARRPFQGKTVLETIVQHLENEPKSVELVRPGVPAPLQAIVRRLMAKDPDQRFQTPAELVAALAPFCGDAGAGQVVAGAPAAAPSVAAAANKPSAGEEIATSVVPGLALGTPPPGHTPPAAEKPVLLARPTPSPAAPRGESAEAALLPATACVPAKVPATLPRPAAPAAPDVVVKVEPLQPPREAPTAKPFRASAALRQSWGQWFSVIQALAAGEQVRVNEPMFRALRDALLQHCHAGEDGDGPGRPAVLVRLEGLVEPWLKPQTLAQMDRESLRSLAQRCYELDEELRGPVRGGLAKILLAVVAIAVVGVVAWILQQQPASATVVRRLSDMLSSSFAARPLWFLGGAAVGVFLLALGLLSCLRRE